jgi:hypothetical protein
MKKSISLVALVTLFAVNASASYWVVMKDGTRYEAKQKWTLHNGKAEINLVSGQTLSVEPGAIDPAKSDEMTRMGGANVIGREQAAAPPRPQQETSALGSAIKLRKTPVVQPSQSAPPPPTPSTAPPIANSAGAMSEEVVQKFLRAYENVGIFEHTVVSTGAHSLRAELTADSEEKVFNAISATSFLTVHDAGIQGVHIDMVELFMKTTTGGSSGRFQMSRADAEALLAKQITKEDYFVRKVIY